MMTDFELLSLSHDKYIFILFFSFDMQVFESLTI